MNSADEISELKKGLSILKHKMEKIGESQRPAVIRLSNQLKEIIEGIESVQENEKNITNTAMSIRMRLAKKAMLLGKGLRHFEMDVQSEFEKDLLSEDSGDRFMSILKLIRENKMQLAKEGMAYFEEIVAINTEYETAEEEIRKKDRVLRKEQFRIQKALEEMAQLEKEKIDIEKVRRHEELLKSLEKLGALRAQYIQSLVSKPVAELLGETEFPPLREYYGELLENGGINQLRQFLSDYPDFGKCNAIQIREFFDCSEKKVSHICPETSRFKKIILGNRGLFEAIGSLEQTSFLAVDDNNEESLDFYAKNINGAQEIVENIRQMKTEKDSYREEYEKSRVLDKRREELGKYSKSDLENELKELGSLLELLHSESAPEEKKEEKRGLFNEIRVLLFGK
jgi:hypothetical protein